MKPTLYTKAEVINMVTETLRVFNYGNPEAKIVPGLTVEDTEIIGLVSLSIPGPIVSYKITDLPIYQEQPLFI